ncbi:MAG: hypothetical protein P0Y56_12180 [Candidatus Andeanibacterium colombiense]|uniref:Tyr recombinase domain-containing protein n=1 Tax=Candidatus Andeanibacterium colombiense TaxID=3121345 RepID=A0AAJ5X714_9SPHN|nr:MAG: hypothetical protein P0Y56_12180 [Sphingomonadaceae bacterium]
MTRHVERDRRSGRLSYRRVYPAPLRPFVPRQTRELKRSLGADRLTPEALSILADAEAEYERTLQAAQRKAKGSSRPLAEADIGFLAQTYAHRLRANLSDTHFDGSDSRRSWLGASAWRHAPFAFMDQAGAELAGRDEPWTNSQRIREALPDLLDGWRALWADGDRAGVTEAEGQSADDLLAEFALSAKPGSDEHFGLCLALLKADIAAGVQLQRLVSEGQDIEPVPLPDMSVPVPVAAPSAASKSPGSTTGETMSSLAESLMKQTADPVSVTTAQSWKTALRFWRELYGELDCHSITRRKVSEWLELLSQRPKGIPKRLDRKALPALVEQFEGDAKVERIAGKTVRQHLGSLSAIWNKAEKRGFIEAPSNPFSNHDVRVDAKTGGQPLTVGELNAVFRLPVFTIGERPREGRGEAAYWMPLLALFTGARPGEIAQLIRSDFWQDESGKWFMRYTDKGEHPAIGQRHLKTSRHGTGERQFPVPQALIDLGLPAYLNWLLEQGHVAMFPKLRATAKGLHDSWSRWWGPYVREHGAIPAGKRQAREFRHNFMTALRASGVTDEAISYLAGHSVRGGSTTRLYGDRSPYGAEIEKLRFEGLDLSAVRPWRAS